MFEIIFFRTKEAVKSLKTVEEKMYQINRPKMFGWYSYIVKTNLIATDLLGRYCMIYNLYIWLGALYACVQYDLVGISYTTFSLKFPGKL